MASLSVPLLSPLASAPTSLPICRPYPGCAWRPCRGSAPKAAKVSQHVCRGLGHLLDLCLSCPCFQSPRGELLTGHVCGLICQCGELVREPPPAPGSVLGRAGRPAPSASCGSRPSRGQPLPTRGCACGSRSLVLPCARFRAVLSGFLTGSLGIWQFPECADQFGGDLCVYHASSSCGAAPGECLHFSLLRCLSVTFYTSLPSGRLCTSGP